MATVLETLGEALRRHQAGDLAVAEQLYMAVLRSQPDEPTALHYLGVVELQRGRPEQAEALLRRAVALRPEDGAAHCNLGNVLQAQGRFPEAVACYERSLERTPQDAVTHHNLGNALVHLGRLAEAAESYGRALASRPEYAEAAYQRGRVLRRLGDFAGAVTSYEQALGHRPDHPETHNELGLLAREHGLPAEAESCFRRALEIRPDFLPAWSNLGKVLTEEGRLAEADDCFRQALALRPDASEAHFNRAVLFEKQGQRVEAAASYRQAAGGTPPIPLAELRAARLGPEVFADTEAIDRYRQGLAEEIERLRRRELRFDLARLAAFGAPPPFVLPFHGRDDRPLKEAYAALFRDALYRRLLLPRGDTPRLGLVVTRNHEGAFLRFLGSVLRRLSRAAFETVVVSSLARQERIRTGVGAEAVRSLALPERLDLAAEAIRAAQFDVLYFWEVGTDATNYILPLLRLAPVQVTSWGVPETSGIAEIDYYLSSRLAEPEGAEAHYTERLVCVPTLLTYQRRIVLPESPRSRADFGFRDDQHLYLCAQRLAKFHPDFDEVLGGILRRDERGVLVLVEDRTGTAAAELRQRFAIRLPDVAERIVFLPRLENADYLALTAAADVLLDPLYYGGGLTTYDGLSLNKPIVTWPGPFLRGRQTFACYQRMGMTECVARDRGHYVELAVTLGADADRRAAVEARLRETSDAIFQDDEAVSAQEKFFEERIQKARDGR